jgi:penicillin-binding protein 1C
MASWAGGKHDGPKPKQHHAIIGMVLLVLLILVTAAHLATRPPAIPEFNAVKSEWTPSEAWLLDRNGQLLDSERVQFDRRRLAWVALQDIHPNIQQAVIANEDKRFWTHGGVDWLALANAAKARWTGGRVRGASTIAMQVAGYLSPELAQPGRRNIRQKIRQIRSAQTLAYHWTHDQILEAYLNLAPLRGELQGIGAGAQLLFGKVPAEFSEIDAALFAALLPNPSANAETLARRGCALADAKNCNAIRAAAGTLITGEVALKSDPALAPHLAVRLLQKPGAKVQSTLDRQTQIIAITALRRQLLGLGSDKVRDGAVVVLDNKTGDALAYVGGVTLSSTSAAVDGANARRQAGSTLKPHLYAQVIDKGWLTAASILDDSPVQLDTASGLYVPKNYDRRFKGPVSVRQALASSLNIPAVRTLLLNDVQQFRDLLWSMGHHGLIEDGDYYGFSLALGSAEVSLIEQTNAFRTYANAGLWSPVRLTQTSKKEPARRIFSEGAAYIIGNILSDPSARADAFGADSALRLPFWSASKTGTSKGMRDNWCIGWTDRYTVGVWVGNLEGDSMRAVSGTSGAAPIWRDIMMALHARSAAIPPKKPNSIETRQITLAGTREPPRTEYFLKGTGQSQLESAPLASARPRITNPVSGSIYALDPDIPLDRQRLGVSITGDISGYRLFLGKVDIGPADGAIQLPPRRGSHLLTLSDQSGKTIDRVRFTVR